MALYLDPLNGGRQIVLDKAVVLIGRQSDCDVILDNSRKVSRRHCAIAQVNDRFMIRDLESMNGVTVNGNRVKREAALQVGDEISFGDVRYVLRDTNAAKGGPQVAKSVAENAAVGPPASPPPAKPTPPLRPANVSQKFPIPIAEEGVDFAVEPSIQVARAPLLSEPQPVRLEPVLELELNGPASRSPESQDQDDGEQLPDIILLEESGEVDAAGGKPKSKGNS
jgi:pSer/pThr/pTyr-binding forkhead associated (FHA) protein